MSDEYRPVNGNADQRVAHALEYIAEQLFYIRQQLERLNDRQKSEGPPKP